MLIKKVKTFLKFKGSDKKLIFEAFILTGIARAFILMIPFKKLKKYIGEYKKESPFEIENEEYIIISRVKWAVNLISRYTPWKSKCFVQALTVQRMLKKRNIVCTIYFGIYKEKDKKVKAHAWTRSGHVFITGGLEKNLFTEVARFCNGK